MPSITLLVGLPGSGKSTWCSANATTRTIISTDAILETKGAALGLNYSQAFATLDFKVVEQEMWELFQAAVNRGEDIVVDRTNMTAKSRRRFLSKVPGKYEKLAVVFEIDDAVLRQRLGERAAATGKSIPEYVIKSMGKDYQPPSLEEGFGHIEFVSA